MSLRASAFNGLVWTYGQQFATQLIQFGVSMILSRLISPAEFGLIGMITIFISISNLLFDGGLTSSLIRTHKVDETDFSTVFFFNIISALLLYLILFISAPYIADFFHQNLLKTIIRIYGIVIIISSFSAVQNTKMTKELQFKKLSLLSLPSIIVGSIVAVYMAYNNYGVWSLVGSAISSTFFNSVILWLLSGWKPKLVFSVQKFKQHFFYGGKMTLAGVLDVVFTNIYQIIIGRYFSADKLGYYTRANSLMMLPVSNISSSLNKVSFPMFSKIQEDQERLKNVYKRIMLMVLFMVAPIVTIMAVLISPLTILLFGEKWLPITHIFQVLAVTGILYPLHMYNLIILQIKGKSGLFLNLEIIKKILTVIVLVISLYFGFNGLLWGQVVFSILALFINTHYAGKMLDYSFVNQIIDILPVFLITLIMAIILFFFDKSIDFMPLIVRIILGVFLGGSIYLFMAWKLKFESFFELLDIFKTKILKK